MLRESIGTSLAQTTAAGKLIKNGAKFPGFLTTDGSLNEDQLQDARDEFNAKYTGALNAGSVPVLNGGWDFKATHGMSMVDAQFVESRKMELQEIARHYGIPAFMVDSTATSTWGSGIEQQMLGFMNLSLDSWLVNWEQALAFSLLSSDEIAKGFYFRFDRDQLANVAPETRAKFYQIMRTIGVYSPNDVRRKEDEPLIAKEDGGDDYSNPNTSSGKATPTPEPVPEPEPVTT
jgi:HK97 family phage portal protein